MANKQDPKWGDSNHPAKDSDPPPPYTSSPGPLSYHSALSNSTLTRAPTGSNLDSEPDPERGGLVLPLLAEASVLECLDVTHNILMLGLGMSIIVLEAQEQY